MHSVVKFIHTLIFITAVYAIPYDSSAKECAAGGKCTGNTNLAPRGGENFYSSDGLNNFFFPGVDPESDGSVQGENGGNGNVARVTVIVTETATKIETATVSGATSPAVQFVPIPGSVSSSRSNDNGLLSGVLGGLLPSSHSPSESAPSDHNSVSIDNSPVDRRPPSNGMSPNSAHPGSSIASNGNQQNQFDDHLIDLDLNVTASIGDLLQATATVTLGLL